MTDTLRDVRPDGFYASQMEVTLLANSINMTQHAHVGIKMNSQVSDRNNRLDGSSPTTKFFGSPHFLR